MIRQFVKLPYRLSEIDDVKEVMVNGNNKKQPKRSK